MGRYAWVWTYDYQIDDGPAIGYGTGLASLRAMLRQKFGRDVTVVEDWKPSFARVERAAVDALGGPAGVARAAAAVAQIGATL